MPNVLVNDYSLTAIANAIREKNGTQNTYKPAQMASAIRAIKSGADVTVSGERMIIESDQLSVNGERVIIK